MAAVHAAYKEGLQLMGDGCELNRQRQATVYSAMVISAVDGMQQLSGKLAEEPIRVEA